MFKRSAKEIQSCSQPDGEIKKPTHLIISVKGSTTELCTVGKIVLNSSYAEFNRDTQCAVCWRAPTEGRKNKGPRQKQAQEKHSSTDHAHNLAGGMCTTIEKCNLKAMALHQFNRD